MEKLLANMQSIFQKRGKPIKKQMRHGKGDRNEAKMANQLAELPMAVPELPTSVASRSEVTSVLRSHVLADGTYKRISAFGQGGVGESSYKSNNTIALSNDVIQARQCWLPSS